MALLSLLMVAVTIFIEPPSFPDVLVFEAPQNSLSKFRGLSPKRLLRGDYVLKNEEPHIDFRLQKQAVALLSFGQDAAESTLLERCVLSIRRRGDFHGPVVIITDAPSARYLNVFDENVIVLKNREEDMKDYFESDGSMKYRRFKTLILEYIDNIPELESVEWVYYLDIDVIMGQPLDDLMDQLNEKYHIKDSPKHSIAANGATPSSQLYFFKNSKTSGLLNFFANSGFIIMNRHTSKYCLELWQHVMDSRREDNFDEASLHVIAHLFDRGDETNCQLVSMDVEDYQIYPMNSYQLLRMKWKSSYPHLIHIMNSWKAQAMQENHMVEFLEDALQLTPEEKDDNLFGKVFIAPSDIDWVTKSELARSIANEVIGSFSSNRAIFLMAFGDTAVKSTLVERCILSIRRRGAFDGKVILLTDARKYRYQNILGENVIVLNNRDEDMKTDYFEYDAMRFKRFKTQLIEYIDEVPELSDIEWLYYMDIDVMMGQPFDQLVKDVEEKYHIVERADDSVSRLYFFKNAMDVFGNNDFIIMNRNNSQYCLDILRKEIDQRPQEKFDQTLLGTVSDRLKEQHNSECELIPMELETYVSYPSNDKDLSEMIKKSSFTNLIHILNSRKVRNTGSEITDAFVASVLKLSAEERQAMKAFGESVVTPMQSVKKTLSFESNPLEEPVGYPWHRWPSHDSSIDYPLNTSKFIAILSNMGKGNKFKSGTITPLKKMDIDENFVRLSGVNEPYIVRNGKVLRHHGDTVNIWGKYKRDESGRHIDWVTLLESAVAMARVLSSQEPRMKAITEGDFPIIYDDFDTPWCGDDLVPVFRMNAISDESECQFSWPSLSLMYYLPERRNILRDSQDQWDLQFKEWEQAYPWEKKKKMAVWRGRETGWRQLYDDRVLPREKMVTLGRSHSDIMDFEAIPEDPGIGTENGQLEKDEMEEEDWQLYRAVVDIDGFASSSNLSKLLCMNSVVLKVEPKWDNYWEKEIEPWVHYIPVKHDLEDLPTQVQWIVDDSNREQVQEIIKNANKWCREKMTWEQYTVDFLWTLLAYAELLSNAPGFLENWKADYDAYQLPALDMAEFRGQISFS